MSASESEEPARLPRLHLVTSDAVLARPDFLPLAARLVERGASRLALHLRAPATPGRGVWEVARELSDLVRRAGGWLIVNDRVDVALAVDADGVQLGRRSLSPPDLPPSADRLKVGASVHGADEAEAVGAVDWLVVGTIWASASHPGAGGAGVGRLAEVARAHPAPRIAIGGVTPARVGEAARAGAYGVAVVRGIWFAPDPHGALIRYLEGVDSIENSDTPTHR